MIKCRQCEKDACWTYLARDGKQRFYYCVDHSPVWGMECDETKYEPTGLCDCCRLGYLKEGFDDDWEVDAWRLSAAREEIKRLEEKQAKKEKKDQ